jgi:hypothetical protein
MSYIKKSVVKKLFGIKYKNYKKYYLYGEIDKRTTMKDTKVINVDIDILGGTPVFYGTRVPVKNLFVRQLTDRNRRNRR